MKLNLLETHDRLKHFGKQADYISQGCQDCIKNRPNEFSNHPFYIYAHKREIDLDERKAIFLQDFRDSFLDITYVRKYKEVSDVPNARLIWSPRLTKPKVSENSMLFKAYPPGDNIKVVWLIPDKALWGQYQKDDMIENETVYESIRLFLTDKSRLEIKEDDDLPDSIIDSIYKEICLNGKYKNNLDFKLKTWADSPSFLV